MAPVTRRDRLVDLAALLLVLAGIALCLVANAQLHEISRYTFQHPGPRTVSALAAADRARYLAYGGVATVVAGVVVGLVGAIRVARRA
jgi:hypothetical protein